MPDDLALAVERETRRRAQGVPYPVAMHPDMAREAAENQLRRFHPTGIVDMTTVRIAVERHSRDRSVVGGLLVDAFGGDRYFIFFLARREDGRWLCPRGSMGLIDRPGPFHALLYEFGPTPSTTDFAGYVVGPRAHRATDVRLTANDGHTITLPVAHRWAAVAAEGEMTPPVTVEVLDTAGAAIWTDHHGTAPAR